MAQIALAWVIRSPAVAAIPGASNVEQLEHNVAAATFSWGTTSTRLCRPSRTSPIAGRAADESILNAATVKHMVKATKFVGEATWNDFWASKRP